MDPGCLFVPIHRVTDWGMTMATICQSCGQLTGNQSYDDSLWGVYYRLRDGRGNQEALSFTADWMDENVQDDEDAETLKLAMEKDMARRGLCPSCGRPNLHGISDNDVMPADEARELAEMYAEQAAEIRAGC